MWELEKLKEWARPALEHDELVAIACYAQSAKQAKNQALAFTKEKGLDERVAKACRWLMIIRRDYGRDAQEAYISSLKEKDVMPERRTSRCIETVTVELLGRRIEIVRPSFYVGWQNEGKEFWLSGNPDVESGFTQQFTCDLPKDFRHISTAEFTALMSAGMEGSYKGREIFAEILLAYLLRRDVDLTDEFYPSPAIFLNDGIALDGQILTVFKKIDRQVEWLSEPAYETTVGHILKDSAEAERQSFSIERLFRKKYDPENLIPKQLDKTNPDLIEYLFEQELEELPIPIQQARFILPPDINSEEVHRGDYLDKKTGGCREGRENIWPLSVDLSFRFRKDGLNTRRQKVSRLILKQITFTPSQRSCGIHLIVK